MEALFFVTLSLLLSCTKSSHEAVRLIQNMEVKLQNLEILVVNQNLKIEKQQTQIAELQKRVEDQDGINKVMQRQLASVRNNCNVQSSVPAYNTTIEDLELRVDLLEEDMYEVQEAVNSLDYYLQETIETVADQGDRISGTEDVNTQQGQILNQVEDDLDQLNSTVHQLEILVAGQTDDIDTISDDIASLENNDDTMDSRIAVIEDNKQQTKNSSFFVSLSSDVVFEDSGQTIIFDVVHFDEGFNYKASSGTYTAPIDGIYQFYAFVRANPYANYHMKVDGVTIVNPLPDDTIENFEATGGSATVRLQAGQNVYIQSGNAYPYTVYGHSTPPTWFYGHLLFLDD